VQDFSATTDSFFLQCGHIKSEACSCFELAEVFEAHAHKSGYWDNIFSDLTGWHEAQGHPF